MVQGQSEPRSRSGEVVPGIVVTRDGRIGPGERDRSPQTFLELARWLADVGRLLWRVARDRRVPWHAKAVAVAAVAYAASPIDIIPDVIPGVGRLDDLFLVARALRHLAGVTGYDLLRELWCGSDDGFALLLVVAGVRR